MSSSWADPAASQRVAREIGMEQERDIESVVYKSFLFASEHA
jgi:hypothetical protein